MDLMRRNFPLQGYSNCEILPPCRNDPKARNAKGRPANCPPTGRRLTCRSCGELLNKLPETLAIKSLARQRTRNANSH
jgi:hypothetical protein